MKITWIVGEFEVNQISDCRTKYVLYILLTHRHWIASNIMVTKNDSQLLRSHLPIVIISI